MQTPKIILLTLDYPPERGGVARMLGALVEESEGAMQVAVEKSHSTEGPGRVRNLEFFWERWPRWWPMVRVCRSFQRTHSTILVSHVLPVGTAALIARAFGGPEYAVLFHGLDLRLIRGLRKTVLLRLICFFAKALFVNSEATKRELLTKVPKAACHILTPGVEDRPVYSRTAAREQLGVPEHKKIALSVCRLVPRKGIDTTVRAIAALQKELDVEYVVIGDGEDRTRLNALVAETGARVEWIPNPDETEKWLWYAAADVFVMPVRETRDDMEGFGIVYLEAARAGVPSIASKSGGASEAVLENKTGLLVDPNSPVEVRLALERLLEDEELRRRMGNAAQERANRDFKWKDRWIKLAKVLEIEEK
jgi:phosphatidyl-myo-inositol dimannoside synthase